MISLFNLIIANGPFHSLLFIIGTIARSFSPSCMTQTPVLSTASDTLAMFTIILHTLFVLLLAMREFCCLCWRMYPFASQMYTSAEQHVLRWPMHTFAEQTCAYSECIKGLSYTGSYTLLEYLLNFSLLVSKLTSITCMPYFPKARSVKSKSVQPIPSVIRCISSFE